MQKSLLFITLLLVVALIAACGGQQASTQPTTAPAATTVPLNLPKQIAPSQKCCALVWSPTSAKLTTKASISPHGRASNAERELGAIVNYVETKDAKDYAANIGLFIEKGYDVIVTVGFALGEATIEAAKAHPEVKFIGVDQFQAEVVPNVAGLIFAEDKAGFLAGVLAAEMSKSNKIAAVLGTNLVPPVVAFKEGFENGAKYVKPDIQVISTYHPGGLDTAFTDPKWGADQAKLAIDQGADVIFGAGGKTGNGALIETAANKGVYCIGVDTDQWGDVTRSAPMPDFECDETDHARCL